MKEKLETLKQHSDKLALLIILAITLLMASLLVHTRAKIKFSEQIELPGTGLKIAVPNSGNWRTSKNWEYKGNKFELASLFAAQNSPVVAFASVSYQMAVALENDPQKFFTDYDENFPADSVINFRQASGLDFSWALTDNTQLHTTLVAYANLPHNRRLVIHIEDSLGNRAEVLSIFDSILSLMSYEPNDLLDSGALVVDRLKQTGLSSFLENKNRSNYFLVTDQNRLTGFAMDVTVDFDSEIDNIEIAGYTLLRGRLQRQIATVFVGDSDLTSYQWKNEISNRSGHIGTQLRMLPTGHLNVIDFSNKNNQQNIFPGPATLPNIFIEEIFSEMVAQNTSQAIFDFLNSMGHIEPTLLTRVDSKNEAYPYAFVVQSLANSNQQIAVFLDANKNIMLQKGTLNLERTDLKTILKHFPEHSEFIREKTETPKSTEKVLL